MIVEEELHGGTQDTEAATDSPRNLFEAPRDSTSGRSNADSTQATRFQLRRVEGADVRSCMRVVTTPFADRLIEST